MWCGDQLGLMHMPRSEWNSIAEQAQARQEIDLRSTPLAAIVNKPAFEGAILGLNSSGELELSLLRRRGDEFASSESHATYRFRVYEGFPSSYDYNQIVNAASTVDDDELQSLRDDQVWFAPVDKSEIEPRYVQMSSSALGIFRPSPAFDEETS